MQMQKNIDTLKSELSSLHAAKGTVNTDIGDEVQQQVAKLREDLAQAQQDADHLRTVNASMDISRAEDGPRIFAEQVAENVKAIREELDARYSDRLKEADETLEKRTNNMKTQLSKKLTDGKAQIRQSLLIEHEEAIQKLRTEHTVETEKLAARHKYELDELQQNEESRFKELQEAWEKDREASHSNNGESEKKAQAETPPNPWQPSEAEARAFLHSNEIARSILRKNIMTQVTKAKDELSTQLKEEYETAITDLQTKANTTKEHAVMMEGKKTAVQVNMANNKARITQFKLGIIEKAAQETPEKAVEEVWSVAKDAKPPPSAAQPPLPGSSSKSQHIPATVSSGQRASSAQNSQQRPGAAVFGQSSPFTQGTSPAQQQTTQANQTAQQPGMPNFGRPSPAAEPAKASSVNEQESLVQQQPAQSQQKSSAGNVDQQLTSSQSSSARPQKPSQPAANHHPNAGTGPGALRGLQQSGLPVARGGSMRGNFNARGRGSGIGRGGPPGLNTNQGQQQGRNSPSSGGMNPGAKQFVPGSKRPRDDEEQGGDAGIGKRIRGGGGSGV